MAVNRREELFGQYVSGVEALDSYKNNLENCKNSISRIKANSKKAEDAEREKIDNELKSIKKTIQDLKSRISRCKSMKVPIASEFDKYAELQKYDDETNRHINELDEQYISQINELDNKIKGISRQYDSNFNNGLELIEGDEKMMKVFHGLIEDKIDGKLPPMIDGTSEKATPSSIIERNNLNSSEDLYNLCREASRLDDFVHSCPRLSSAFLVAISVIVALALGIIIKSASFDFVGTVINFLRLVGHKILYIVIFSAIFVAILSLVSYFAHILNIKIAAIAGVVLGIFIGFNRAGGVESIKAGVATTVVRVIVFILLVAAFMFLEYSLGLHQMIMVLAVSKIPAVYKIAMQEQLNKITQKADSYNALINHYDIVEVIECGGKGSEMEMLREQMDRLCNSRQAEIDSYTMSRADERDSYILRLEENFDSIQAENMKKNQSIDFDISDLENKIGLENHHYESIKEGTAGRIETVKNVFMKQIDEQNMKIDSLKVKVEDAIEALRKIVNDFDDAQMPMIEETNGQMSESIYWKEKAFVEKDIPVIKQLTHDQRGMLFLYESSGDAKAENEKIYEVVMRVIEEFAFNNSIDVIDFNVFDPYMGGGDLRAHSDLINVYDKSELRDLMKRMATIFDRVASSKKGSTWNEVIQAEVKTAGDLDMFRCMIVGVIVPAKSLYDAKIDEDFWSYIARSKNKGVIPLFFVKNDDYVNCNSSESNGDGVMSEIKKIFSDENNTYVINLDTLLVK